jgi:hypothetical protein
MALPGLLRYGHALTGNPHDDADLVQGCWRRSGRAGTACWARGPKAVATGVRKPGPDDALGCHTFFTESYPDMVGATVIRPKAGIVRITLPSRARTSAGGAGSTVAEIKAKYPNVNESRNGLTVPMFGTPSWYYAFAVDGSGELFTGTEKIVRVRMEQVPGECYSGWKS